MQKNTIISRAFLLVISRGQRVSLTDLLAAPLRRQRSASPLLITSSCKASFNFMHHPFFLKQRFFFLLFFFSSPEDLGIMLNWDFFNFRNWLLGMNFNLLSVKENPQAGEISFLNGKNKNEFICKIMQMI